jgi:regulator of replication initiation timing
MERIFEEKGVRRMTGQYKIISDNLGEYSVVSKDNVIVATEIQHRITAETFCEELNILAEENEQLKKENYELHKRLGDFEPFEEYIKERTSKTSVNDIIGLVKTDEPTNSVELKKELYK